MGVLDLKMRSTVMERSMEIERSVRSVRRQIRLPFYRDMQPLCWFQRVLASGFTSQVS